MLFYTSSVATKMVHASCRILGEKKDEHKYEHENSTFPGSPLVCLYFLKYFYWGDFQMHTKREEVKWTFPSLSPIFCKYQHMASFVQSIAPSS